VTVCSRLVLAAGTAVLLGCAAPPGKSGITRAADVDCVALYRQFDVLDRTLSIPRRERWAVAPEFMHQADRLRRADCITLSRDLDLAGAAPAPAAGATPIAPVSLHAGVVTNMADAAAARAYFEANGVRARGIGHAALGRRIYLGPFDTEEALGRARDLAIAAGFGHPYARRF